MLRPRQATRRPWPPGQSAGTLFFRACQLLRAAAGSNPLGAPWVFSLLSSLAVPLPPTKDLGAGATEPDAGIGRRRSARLSSGIEAERKGDRHGPAHWIPAADPRVRDGGTARSGAFACA